MAAPLSARALKVLDDDNNDDIDNDNNDDDNNDDDDDVSVSAQAGD